MSDLIWAINPNHTKVWICSKPSRRNSEYFLRRAALQKQVFWKIFLEHIQLCFDQCPWFLLFFAEKKAFLDLIRRANAWLYFLQKREADSNLKKEGQRWWQSMGPEVIFGMFCVVCKKQSFFPDHNWLHQRTIYCSSIEFRYGLP